MSRKTSSATINQTAIGEQNIQIAGSYNTVIQRLAPLGSLPREKNHYSRMAAAVCLLVSLPLLAAGAWLPGWFAPALTVGGILLLTSIVFALKSALFVRVLYYQRQVIRDYENYRRQNIHIELFANVRPDPFVESAGDAKRLSTLARESPRPLVILGDPGSGKTESLRWLAAFFSHRCWGAIPVRVELRDIARVFNDDSSRLIGVSPEWLDPDIESVLRTGLGRYDDILADHLFTLLKKGKLIVMVDALDELRYRSELPAELRKLMQTYPRNKYVLTCRRHDYSRYQAALGENINLADLCPFGREDVVTFLQAQVGSQAEELFKNLERFHLMDFASNPLTLWMLSILWLERLPGQALPRNRGAIIQAYVQALLRRNRKKAGTTNLYSWLDDSPFIQILASAAARLIGGERLELKAEDMEDVLVGSPKKPSSQAVLDQAIDAGLIRQTNRPGLAAAAAYQFVHRQVLEYLGAEWFLLQWLTGPATFQVHLDHPWWEPHVLQTGLLDQASRESLVRSILAQRSDRRAIFLAIACAGVEAGLSKACLLEIRSALKDVAQAGLLPEDEETLIQLGKVGGQPAVEIVADLLELPNQSIRLGCVHILGAIGADSGAIALIERALKDSDPQVSQAAVAKLKHVCTNVSHGVLDRLVDRFGWLRNWELPLEVANEVKTPAIQETLINRLSTDNILIVAGCALVLGKNARNESAEVLASLVTHPNKLVQLSALHGLSQFTKSDFFRREKLLKKLDLEMYIPAEIDRYLLIFRECLESGRGSTVVATIKALGNTEDERIIPMLEAVVDQLDETGLKAVVNAASSVGSEAARPLLTKLARGPSPAVSRAAQAEIEKLDKPAVETRLSSTHARWGILPSIRLDQGDNVLNARASIGLSSAIRHPSILLRYLPDDDEGIVTAAALGIGSLNDAAAKRQAIVALTNQNAALSRRGWRARKKIKHREKLTIIITASLSAGTATRDERLRFARLLASCCPMDYANYGEYIDLISKQSRVVAGIIYMKQYGEDTFDDLAQLLADPVEDVMSKVFAAFALTALFGRRATSAVCDGLKAQGRLTKTRGAWNGFANRSTHAIRASAECLEALRDPLALPHLTDAVWRTESEANTLMELIEAINAIGAPEAIPTLYRVARYDKTHWGDLDEIGGRVSDIAASSIRSLRRRLVQNGNEKAREIYERMLKAETLLEQRFEPLQYYTTGRWLPRKLTALSMRSAGPTMRYYLAKAMSSHRDPRQSLWHWVRWFLKGYGQILNNQWLHFSLGMVVALFLLVGAFIAAVRGWWYLFSGIVGKKLLGLILGTWADKWIGVGIGVLVSLYLGKRVYSSHFAKTMRDWWQTERQREGIYDWVLEQSRREGITFECALQ